jgi:hypothetical protein
MIFQPPSPSVTLSGLYAALGTLNIGPNVSGSRDPAWSQLHFVQGPRVSPHNQNPMPALRTAWTCHPPVNKTWLHNTSDKYF